MDSLEPRVRRTAAARAQRQRVERRRRIVAVVVFVACLVVIAVALAGVGGGGRPASAGARTGHGTRAAGRGTRAAGHGIRAAGHGTAVSASAGARGQTAAASHGAGRIYSTPAGYSTVSPTASGGTPGTTPVPVLMYHVIAPPPAGAPYPGLYVPAPEFAAQMQALKAAGWHAVTLDQVEAYWTRGVPLGPGKPVVLTFDNGYHSQYAAAFPVLQRLGWVADENMQLTGLPPSQGGLTGAEIRALVASGWELDTQGISHADLIALGPSALYDQVAVARRTIQRRFHVPVNWFCYPSGHYNATVIAAVRAAGYVGSTTVIPGWAHSSDNPYELHRLRVLGGTSPSALLQQIAQSEGDPPAPPSYS